MFQDQKSNFGERVIEVQDLINGICFEIIYEHYLVYCGFFLSIINSIGIS